MAHIEKFQKKNHYCIRFCLIHKNEWISEFPLYWLFGGLAHESKFLCKDEFLGLNYDFLSVQGIKCYKGVTTDGISSMPSQKTEKNCTEGVTQCLKKSTYYLPSGYIAPQGN